MSRPHIIIIFLLFTTLASKAQKVNAYNLKVVNNKSYYKSIISEDSSQKLVELKSIIPDIVYDLRYATTNNFTEKRLYPSGTQSTYLRYDAAIALKKVAEELKAMGYGIKIYDAYRPYAVTKKFWKLIGDERYVAHPRSGSGHNRGLAVDLTIIRLDNGEELEMGTGYDDFRELAHHGAEGITEVAKTNREILKSTMLKHGFRLFETEWWHYSWPNENNKYEVMDFSFKQLEKLGRNY